jgi:anti-sigma factor (TIGR02949 family)
MSENNCKDNLSKVYDFLADELDKDQKSQIINHLTDCENCKREYAIESKISKLLSSSSQNAQFNFAAKMQSRFQAEN